MKELILENPPKRRKARKSGKRRTRSAAQRAATAKMLAANRKRRMVRTVRKTRKVFKKRTVRKAVRKLRTSTVRKHYKAMARKSRRKSHRRKSHTYAFRGMGSPIKLNGMIGNVFSRENLTIAAGAVGGTVITNYALGSAMGAKLPGVGSPYTRTAYNILIPVLAGMVVKKYSPNLSKGLILGGLVNGIGQLVTATRILPAGQTAPVQVASLPAPKPSASATGEYLGAYLGASQQPDTFSAFAEQAF